MWIGYRPEIAGNDLPEAVCFQFGLGPGAQGSVLTPKQMLDYCYGHTVWKQVDGQRRFAGYVKEPPGWFERKCREANCEWFVPPVKRMAAAGEHVALEEIQAAYLAHNGKPMPCGKWRELFR